MSYSSQTEAASSSAPVAERGELCPACRRRLPIRAKRPGEVAAHWECAACRSPMTGVLLTDAVGDMAESIRIGQVHFDLSAMPPLPASLRQLVKEFVASRHSAEPVDERRTAPRVPLQLEMAVVPLDQNWTPQAKPMHGLVVDITSSGLGMVTAAALEAEQVALQIRRPSGPVQLLGKIVWSKELGPGFHNAGVQFFLRFGRCPVAG